MAVRQQQENRQTIQQAVASGAAPATNKPKPSEFDNYQVAPDQPRYIFIPKINVRAIVRNLGINKSGEIAAPSNVFDSGWFNQSSKPGQLGAMVIDGHISSWSTKGVFYDLNKLKPGDDVQVQKGDNVRVNYVVVQTQTYEADKVDMGAVLSPIDPSKPGLNLISCAGSVVKGTNQFDKRIVVFTKQI